MPERKLLLMGVGAVRLCAWFLLLLGLVTLCYALFGEFTLRLLRGGAFEAALGVFGLVYTSSLRRKLALSPR